MQCTDAVRCRTYGEEYLESIYGWSGHFFPANQIVCYLPCPANRQGRNKKMLNLAPLVRDLEESWIK